MIVKGPIKPFNTIGPLEQQSALASMTNRPLSEYLAGKERGGSFVQALEEEWSATFNVRHSVVVNSATSGLLAACAAIELRPGDDVVTTPYTMSATSAAPAFFNSNIIYGDIDEETFCLKPSLSLLTHKTKAVIATNLLGHPAHLAWWRRAADTHGFFLIEDNAQSPFAMEHDRFAGTVGHIGVFSLNCHKHIQAGEGGVCTTNDDDLALKMRMFINHAEGFR